LNFKSLF